MEAESITKTKGGEGSVNGRQQTQQRPVVSFWKGTQKQGQGEGRGGPEVR